MKNTSNNQLDFFDDLINVEKERNKRTSFSFTKKDDSIMSAWEVGNFISMFSSYYYKSDLMNNILTALSLGIHPENIFVLDKSPGLKQFSKYNSLSHIDLSNLEQLYSHNHISNLHSIGLPYSIYPNIDISVMNRMFSAINQISQYVNIKHTGELFHIISSYYSNSTNKVDICKYFLSMLSRMGEQTPKRKDADNAKIKEIIDNSQKEFDKIFSFEYLNINSPSYYESINNLTKEQGNSIFKSIQRFFYYFKSVKRPIVGIYYKPINQIQILGTQHINNDFDSESYLDLKSMSHNSPTVFEFIGGLFTMGSTLINTFNNSALINEERRIDIDIKLQKLEQEKIKTQCESRRLILLNMEIAKKLSGDTDYLKTHNNKDNSPNDIVIKSVYTAYKKTAKLTDDLLIGHNLTSEIKLDEKA